MNCTSSPRARSASPSVRHRMICPLPMAIEASARITQRRGERADGCALKLIEASISRGAREITLRVARGLDRRSIVREGWPDWTPFGAQRLDPMWAKRRQKEAPRPKRAQANFGTIAFAAPDSPPSGLASSIAARSVRSRRAIRSNSSKASSKWAASRRRSGTSTASA